MMFYLQMVIHHILTGVERCNGELWDIEHPTRWRYSYPDKQWQPGRDGM